MEHKRTRWMDGVAVLLLCLLSVAVYRHILLSNRILSGGDAFTYFYPYRAYAAEALRHGRLPLWNPYLFLGVPYLANPQAAVLYPLNWFLAWLPAPKLVAWSIAIHVALAAGLAYLYARRSLRLSPLPAYLGASTYALGGFLSGQAEHVNQLNVSAWFPLLLYLWDLADPVRSRGVSCPAPAFSRYMSWVRWPPLLALGAVIGLGLLAGHTQSSYISLFGLTLYAFVPVLVDAYRALRARASLRTPLQQGGRVLLGLVLATLIGAALAAAQLLPTLELSRYSIRSGGLSYREAVAFSLRPLPRLLRYTFLPPWGGDLASVFGGSYYTEFLAYVGVVPLLLIATWGIAWLLASVVGRRGGYSKSLHEIELELPTVRVLVLAAAGLLLALGLYNPLYLILYRLLPGFALFRVPARWLLLYAFSAPMLAALAMQHLRIGIRERIGIRGIWLPAAGLLLVVITAGELLWAACALPFSDPTAPEAWSALRTAPAHILAAQAERTVPGRFLSMSDILFDPGDLAEMQAMFEEQLSPGAIYDYVVAAKRKEILAPNLPLAWHVYAVDGYDGGLLPLARYIQLQHLFLEPDEILTDGRLREGLDEIPPARLLSLLGVRYVITDKVHDAWIDNVFYDLSLDAALTGTPATGTAASIIREDMPAFAATGVGLLSYLEGADQVAEGTPVARVDLQTTEGQMRSFLLRAGVDTAEGLYTEDVRHSQVRIGRAWPDEPAGSYYLTRLGWGQPAQIARLEIAALPIEGTSEPPGITVHVRGCTLIDERDGSNVTVLLSTAGDYRLVHSGDVKIYEVRDALPHTYVVYSTRVVADDEAALAALADPAFQPGQEALLAAGQALQKRPNGPPEVRVTAYRPEAAVIHATLEAPGYLILSDAWYPGWRATVDGEQAVIERANTMFRAVYLPAGPHEVHLIYRPVSFYAGAAISAFVLVGIAFAAVWMRRAQKARTHDLGE